MRDHGSLSAGEKSLFRKVLDKFVADLTEIEQGGREEFRKSLRVKDVEGSDGVWEMTWEWPDGRATFQYGEPIEIGMRHVVWRRVGSHAIFERP